MSAADPAAEPVPRRGGVAGQVAVVTGGASGIGLATAALLRSDGATVALLDRDADALGAACTSLGVDAAAGLPVDVGDEQGVGAAIESVLGRYGRIDVLVNSAGITAASRPLWDVDTEFFTTMLRIHLLGTFFCCRAAVPAMRAAGYGRIVNVASVAGKEGNANSAPYSAAKAGVIAMTKSLGKELAGSGVLANTVTPGVTRTPMVAQATPSHIDGLLARMPMGRPAEPDEVAEMIAWLASPRCSFSTGAVFDVSGGRTSY